MSSAVEPERENSMELTALLQSAGALYEKYDARYKKTGAYFNIFSITGIADKEVRICRVIRELIDPRGSHYQGSTYLRLFVRHVLPDIENELSDADYENASVIREKLIKDDRRIDLFLKIGTFWIPIEVKLYGPEQKNQCMDYYQYARGPEPKLYYLTLDGHKPSPKSLGKLIIPHDVKLISFKDEITTWLTECLKDYNTAGIAPIREIMLQLLNVIKRMTNQTQEGLDMAIQNLLLSSPDNFRNADLLCKAIRGAEEDLKQRVFRALDKRIEENYIQVYNGKDESVGNNSLGISYRIHDLSEPGCELYFRIEIDHRLFFGIHVAKNKEWIEAPRELANEIRKGITTEEQQAHEEWAQDDRWVAWKYFWNEAGETFNFKSHNEAFYSLIDSKHFEEFLDRAMKDIASLMAKLNAPSKEISEQGGKNDA